MMTGIVTDIQKFSLHDGDGIRTTVFLKGCNMRCVWCHNPETLSCAPQEAYYKEKCIGCGHCKDYCPTGARVMIGKEKTPEEVFDEIAADLDYYKNSNGGVTVSGGEPLMQADFTAAILKLCKEHNINTAIESNVSLPFSNLEKLIPFLDCAFFDVKIFEDENHKKYTGISNKSIFDNVRKLDSYNIKMVMRTPLIPGITDSDENIRNIGKFAGSLKNLCYYELLNYNVLAPSKYEFIGKEYTLGKLKRLSEERVADLARIAGENGATVVCGQE